MFHNYKALVIRPAKIWKKNYSEQKTLENIVLAFGGNEKRHPKRMPFPVVDNRLVFSLASDSHWVTVCAIFTELDFVDVNQVAATISGNGENDVSDRTTAVC